MRFTKETIFKVLRLKKTIASDYIKLMEPKGISKVEEWIANPNGNYKKRFGQMSIKEFKVWKTRKLRALRKQYDSGESEGKAEHSARQGKG